MILILYVHPGAPEICDGKDSNCDGSQPFVDKDNDGDGVLGCAGDGDDTDPNVHPGAPEICDGKDSNCDGSWPATDVDQDGDGVPWCANDCDDLDPNNFPGNIEICNDGQDNDCNNDIDNLDVACIFLCTTKLAPKDGPHMFDLLDPADDSVLQQSCNWCHFDQTGSIDERDACQRCHSHQADTSDPLNGILKAQFPLAPPYGFGTATIKKLHSSDTVGTKYGTWANNCIICHNPHLQEQNMRFGTSYGKYIKDYICYNGYEEKVEFTSGQGPGSFADGAPHNLNICEMCHTQTNFHRRDGLAPGDLDPQGGYVGHNDNNDCKLCHDHSQGFGVPFNYIPAAPHNAPAFFSNCDYCHITTGNFTAPIPDAKCEQCHTPNGVLKLANPAAFGTAPNVKAHTDLNGTGKYTYTNTCVGCHNPMYSTPNLRYVRDDLTLVGGGANVSLTTYLGAGSFADGPPYDQNVCETCHTLTNHHQKDGTAPGGQSHNDGSNCTICHSHDNAFLATASPQRRMIHLNS